MCGVVVLWYLGYLLFLLFDLDVLRFSSCIVLVNLGRLGIGIGWLWVEEVIDVFVLGIGDECWNEGLYEFI